MGNHINSSTYALLSFVSPAYTPFSAQAVRFDPANDLGEGKLRAQVIAHQNGRKGRLICVIGSDIDGYAAAAKLHDEQITARTQGIPYYRAAVPHDGVDWFGTIFTSSETFTIPQDIWDEAALRQGTPQQTPWSNHAVGSTPGTYKGPNDGNGTGPWGTTQHNGHPGWEGDIWELLNNHILEATYGGDGVVVVSSLLVMGKEIRLRWQNDRYGFAPHTPWPVQYDNGMYDPSPPFSSWGHQREFPYTGGVNGYALEAASHAVLNSHPSFMFDWTLNGAITGVRHIAKGRDSTGNSFCYLKEEAGTTTLLLTKDIADINAFGTHNRTAMNGVSPGTNLDGVPRGAVYGPDGKVLVSTFDNGSSKLYLVSVDGASAPSGLSAIFSSGGHEAIDVMKYGQTAGEWAFASKNVVSTIPLNGGLGSDQIRMTLGADETIVDIAEGADGWVVVSVKIKGDRSVRVRTASSDWSTIVEPENVDPELIALVPLDINYDYDTGEWVAASGAGVTSTAPNLTSWE